MRLEQIEIRDNFISTESTADSVISCLSFSRIAGSLANTPAAGIATDTMVQPSTVQARYCTHRLHGTQSSNDRAAKHHSTSDSHHCGMMLIDLQLTARTEDNPYQSKVSDSSSVTIGQYPTYQKQQLHAECPYLQFLACRASRGTLASKHDLWNYRGVTRIDTDFDEFDKFAKISSHPTRSMQLTLQVLILQLFGSGPCMHLCSEPLCLTINRNIYYYNAIAYLLYLQREESMIHTETTVQDPTRHEADVCACQCCNSCPFGYEQIYLIASNVAEVREWHECSYQYIHKISVGLRAPLKANDRIRCSGCIGSKHCNFATSEHLIHLVNTERIK